MTRETSYLHPWPPPSPCIHSSPPGVHVHAHAHADARHQRRRRHGAPPHFYMHEDVTGPSATSVRGGVARGPVPLPGSQYNFGDLVVVDDLLTDGPSAASRPVGRAQGTFTVARSEPPVPFVLSLVLADDGAHNGSTVACVGRDLVVAPVQELAVIVGGGAFRMAHGYVLVRTHSANATTGDAVLELDVYAKKHREKR